MTYVVEKLRDSIPRWGEEEHRIGKVEFDGLEVNETRMLLWSIENYIISKTRRGSYVTELMELYVYCTGGAKSICSWKSKNLKNDKIDYG